MTAFFTLAGVAAIHPVIAGAAIIALSVLVGLEIAATLWNGGSSKLLHCVALLAGMSVVGALLAAGLQHTNVGKILAFLSVALASAVAVAAVMILRKPAEPAPALAAEPAPTSETP
jgi:hypothetical protein